MAINGDTTSCALLTSKVLSSLLFTIHINDVDEKIVSKILKLTDNIKLSTNVASNTKL